MQYDMVFEGGGAKGMVFVGAMEAFEEAGLTYDRLVGSSAGAITAVLLAAGYDAAEFRLALEETLDDGRPVFSTFFGQPDQLSAEQIRASGVHKFLRSIDLPLTPEFIEKRLDERLAFALSRHRFGRNIFSLVEYGGLFSAEPFEVWFKGKLDQGTYEGKPRAFSQMTLKQFYEKTKRDVSLTASNLTQNRLMILNHRTAPDVPVVAAVRMSMNIPFLWQEVVWQESWGTYHGDPATDNVVVDGGLLSNFPIELFVSELAPVVAVMGPKRNDNVMGLLIDDKLPVADAPPAEKGKNRYVKWVEGFNTTGRLSQTFNTLLQARDKMVIREFEQLVVRIPAEGYGTTDFGMSEARRKALVQSGVAAMQKHLSPTASAKSFDPSALEAAWAEADEIALSILK